MRPLFRLAALCAFLVACSFAAPRAVADDDAPVAKPRIKLFMASADRVMADLEWIIATLAKEESQWHDNLKDIIETFLFGVDYEKPIRFDAMIGGEEDGEVKPGTYRFQPSIPVARDGRDVKTFIDKNLEPLGIKVKQKSRQGYYQLSDVYKGWMRLVDEYFCIGTYESDVPKDMPNPKESHETLVEAGFDIALELDNDPAETEARADAFDKVAENILDATKIKEGESEAVFARRKGSVNRKMEKLEGLFVNARRVTIGWITDVENETGRADLYGEGLPGSDLEKYIGMIATEPSVFAALEIPEDPAASLRINWAFDEMWQRHQAEAYELARPVVHEKIDNSDALATSEKEPSKQLADLLFDMLTEGIELGRLELFVDMTKAEESGKHVIIFGVRAKDAKKADEIVKLIPAAHEAWSVEMDVDNVGETAIHKIDISEDLPASVADMFGESGAVYVGTSQELVWICGGEGSLELLKETVTRVDESEPPEEVSPVFGEFKVHVHTLLKLYDSLVVEMGWNPMGTIDVKPQGKKSSGEGPQLQPIDPAEIRDIATRATADIDDRVSGVARRIDNHAEGEILVEPGLLKAIGNIIAKIAADNL